jgi:DME family drug/metabolite transporter
MKQAQLSGTLEVIIASILWSFGGLGLKLVTLDASALGGYRALFTIPIFLLVLFMRRQHFSWIILKEPILYLAAFCYSATIYSFVIANSYTTAAHAIFLQYTAPFYTAILSWIFFKEKLTRHSLMALCLATLGMVICFTDQISGGSYFGDSIALLSGIAFAGVAVSLRALGLKFSSQPKAGSMIGIVAILFGNCFTVIFSMERMTMFVPSSLQQWILVGILGLLLGVSYWIYTIGAPKIPAFDGMMLLLLEPILNPIWVALYLGEIPGKKTLFGALLIFSAIALLGVASNRPTFKSSAKR